MDATFSPVDRLALQVRRRHKTYFATIANLLNHVIIFAVVTEREKIGQAASEVCPEKLSRQSQSAARAAVFYAAFLSELWSRLANKISSEVGRANYTHNRPCKR